MPLDPEIAAWLETQNRLPPRSTLDIAAMRERLRQLAALAGPCRESFRWRATR
jgi:hypothetical protein